MRSALIPRPILAQQSDPPILQTRPYRTPVSLTVNCSCGVRAAQLPLQNTHRSRISALRLDQLPARRNSAIAVGVGHRSAFRLSVARSGGRHRSGRSPRSSSLAVRTFHPVRWFETRRQASLLRRACPERVQPVRSVLRSTTPTARKAISS